MIEAPLPTADLPVPLDEVWRHFRVTELRVRCRRPAGFDTGFSLAGRVRGALGHALRRLEESGQPRSRLRSSISAYRALFGEPMPTPPSAGRIFHNPTRPYVLAAEADGDEVVVTLALFGWAAIWAGEVRCGLRIGLEGGISIAAGARSRARLEVLGLVRAEPPIRVSQHTASAVTLAFVTPVCLMREGALVADREVFVSSLLARVAGLAAWHGLVLEPDLPRLAAAEEGLELDTAGLRAVGFERIAAMQRRRVPMRGFLGTATLSGELEPFLPVLTLAPWVRLGAHTTFGMGCCRLLAG